MENKQKEKQSNLYWFLKNGVWIGWTIGTLYVTIIVVWSLFDKNNMLVWFDWMSPVSDFSSKFIPMINRHSSQLIDHGYIFEAARARNLYSMIWIIGLIFSTLTFIYIYTGNRFVNKENKISLRKLVLVHIGILIAFGIISFYGIDINFDSPGRRSYAVHRTSFFYFFQAVSVCVIYGSLAILFDRIIYLTRGNTSAG